MIGKTRLAIAGPVAAGLIGLAVAGAGGGFGSAE